jgi:hypothetical protein
MSVSPASLVEICADFNGNQPMKPKFNHGDPVQVRAEANGEFRPGAEAWIVGVFAARPGPYFDKFPEGVVYTIEFEDGSSLEIHEKDLEARTSDAAEN